MEDEEEASSDKISGQKASSFCEATTLSSEQVWNKCNLKFMFPKKESDKIVLGRRWGV